MMFFGLQGEAELFVALAIMLWFRHAENIQRLLNGTEGKIGQKAEPKS